MTLHNPDPDLTEVCERAGGSWTQTGAGHVAGLAVLARSLAAATGQIPAVMVQVGDVDGAYSQVSDCHGAVVITVDEALVLGRPGAGGGAAAGALAHEIECQARDELPAEVWARRVWATALLTFGVATVAAWATAAWIALVVAGAARLAQAFAERRAEYRVDAAAARMLGAAGLDGRACLWAMLAHLAAAESGIYQRLGWVVSGAPRAADRAQALRTGVPYLRWRPVCPSTGHQVGTFGHRRAHLSDGARCRPWTWDWRPDVRRRTWDGAPS
ncbi:hypothetical protein [Bailinhaonella thermotolerans]|uniref:Peptidase M48 domain-containing protein n=1 Tax=Bailinhaonella thermotolerans TaxID=1070861 RepID=A0A3A4A031_9ACTN|nr:hypothetical protein [Bailinhaonella thermotolerans]RJL20195.1 hypothetical protein D5H75_39805 [Bailinhaonella thermotolerans]